MEQEIIVVKKKKKNLVIYFVIVVILYITANALNRYAINTIVNNVVDGKTGEDDFTIYHLLSMISTMAMFILFIQGGNLLISLFDKEKIVSVKKSSYENVKAREYLDRMKKISLMQMWINCGAFALLVAFAGQYYIRTGDRWNFLYAMVILWIIYMINPVGKLMSLFDKKKDILIDECAPVAYLAFIELASVEAPKLVRYNYPLLIKSASCYYMGDYGEMSKLLDEYESRKIKVHEGINALYYRGAAFINMGNSGGFNYISSKLSNIEKNIRLSDNERELANNVRTIWQILIGISGTDPLSVKELVLNEMKKNEKMLFRIELTYYLSIIQLASGDEETAILNLRYVAQNGGTTVFCSKAKQLLISRDIDVSGYQSGLSFE